MFKYVIYVKLKDSTRGAIFIAKKEEDLDVSTEQGQQEYLSKFNVVPAMQKIFGEDNVLKCTVTDKSQVRQYA